MSPDKDKLLCDRYPKIFAERHGDMQTTAMCWGFDCGDGWFTLVDHLCRNLQWDTDHNKHPQVVASQVKEKFGGLRFYVHKADDRQHGMIDLVESMSCFTCEECGSPGKINKGPWLMCRCPKHSEKVDNDESEQEAQSE